MKKLHPGIYEPRKQQRLIGGLKAAHARHETWDTTLFGKPWKLCQAFAKVIPPEARVIDIGSGVGRHVRALRDLGYDIIGLDGTPGIEEISEGMVECVDLTVTEECRPYFKSCEWGLCWGVGEHVPAMLDQIFLDNIMTMPTEGMIMAWAEPGTPGKGHVNCRPLEDIKHEFDRAGWVYNEEMTQIILGAFKRGSPAVAVFLD